MLRGWQPHPHRLLEETGQLRCGRSCYTRYLIVVTRHHCYVCFPDMFYVLPHSPESCSGADWAVLCCVVWWGRWACCPLANHSTQAADTPSPRSPDRWRGCTSVSPKTVSVSRALEPSVSRSSVSHPSSSVELNTPW